MKSNNTEELHTSPKRSSEDFKVEEFEDCKEGSLKKQKESCGQGPQNAGNLKKVKTPGHLDG